MNIIPNLVGRIDSVYKNGDTYKVDEEEKAEESQEEKEKERVRADFDRETVRILSRVYAQNDDIDEVLMRNKYKVKYIIQDVAQALLINKRTQE